MNIFQKTVTVQDYFGLPIKHFLDWNYIPISFNNLYKYYKNVSILFVSSTSPQPENDWYNILYKVVMRRKWNSLLNVSFSNWYLIINNLMQHSLNFCDAFMLTAHWFFKNVELQTHIDTMFDIKQVKLTLKASVFGKLHNCWKHRWAVASQPFDTSCLFSNFPCKIEKQKV